MQFSTLALIAALVSRASAQLSDIPSCANLHKFPSTLDAIGQTGCATTDIACICRSSVFLANLTPAIRASCPPADFQTAIEATAVLCAQYNPAIASTIALATSTTSSSAAGKGSSLPTTTMGANTTSQNTTSTSTSASIPPVITANVIAGAGRGSFAVAVLVGVGGAMLAIL